MKLKTLSYNELTGEFCNEESAALKKKGFNVVCKDLPYRVDLFKEFIDVVLDGNPIFSFKKMKKIWDSFENLTAELTNGEKKYKEEIFSELKKTLEQ